jgi:hypothetical protein
MRRFSSLAVVLAASVSAATAAPVGTPFPTNSPPTVSGPVRTYFSTDPNPASGLRGWHIDRPSSEKTPHGISLDINGSPVWDMGIDFEFPDLILGYSHVTQSDQFRFRIDTGQLEIGPRVGHPVTASQVNVTAGTDTAPLDGVGVGAYGSQNNLYLYQKLPGQQRTKVNLYDLFQVGTDSTQSNSSDFWVFNNLTGRFPLLINATDNVAMGNGATVGKTLQHTGATLGFFGATPIARPTVSHSRKDGSALADLISKLAALGLVTDQTNP